MINYPVLNGSDAYAWVDVKISFLKRTAVDIKSISYSQTAEKQDIYGAGASPVKRGRGKKAATCSMSISLEEVQKLVKIAPGQDITNIPMFDIMVSYQVSDLQRVFTDVVRNVEFTSNPRTPAEGNLSFDLNLDMICSHIDYGTSVA
jgi:hypothetical protein